MYQLAAAWKMAGESIALVPTMGCLHEGHLSLMRIALEKASKVIVSLFVNPMQFGPKEDFASYPRQLQIDCELAEKTGVHAVFCPDQKDMYPADFQTKISLQDLPLGLCGADRPGHFDGVATVVCKLLHLTCPGIAVFGLKDFQQLAVIRQMVSDLNFPVTIVGAPIVREPDGLAMSSRNKYLRGEMRDQALCLIQAIRAAQEMVNNAGQQVTVDTLVTMVRKRVADAGGKLEYATVIHEETLKPEKVVGSTSVLAIAVKIGGTVRLIDNARLMFSET